MTRVYVGNLGKNGSRRELEREFERFGPLRDVWVARNPPGFAFVLFEDARDAKTLAMTWTEDTSVERRFVLKWLVDRIGEEELPEWA